MGRASKIALWTAGVVLFVVGGIAVAFHVSPWPSVLLIRRGFGQGGETASNALTRHIPDGVAERLDVRYHEADDDTYMDVFFPANLAESDTVLPTIMWVHGGGFVAGTKDGVANYARVLAGRGVTVVCIDYSVAPGAKYPTPVRQANSALAYLVRAARELHVDSSRLFLAGDSGGAHIVAQLAAAISDSTYATALGVDPSIERSRLAGTILYCGPYDLDLVDFEGPFGGFLKTVLWSYLGRKDFLSAPGANTFSVVNFVTPSFPPTFISVGNADPLQRHSRAMAAAIARQGVEVDSLFFAANRRPPLPHEYQFDLDDEAGRRALERSLAFVWRQ